MNGWGTRITPPIHGLHPFGAALRAFKIAPDDFVERGPNIEPATIQTLKPQNWGFIDWMAGELGFEPRLTESESAVLPLDDSPKNRYELRGTSGEVLIFCLIVFYQTPNHI